MSTLRDDLIGLRQKLRDHPRAYAIMIDVLPLARLLDFHDKAVAALSEIERDIYRKTVPITHDARRIAREVLALLDKETS